MKTRILITVLLVALITAGCTSKPEQTAASVPPVQNFAAGIAPENTNPESGITQVANGQYPTSPEGVVQAFLATYGANPQDALPYLTAGAQATLNSAALQFEGSIEGFTIDQAAVNPDLPGAFIGVAIQVSGVESRRDFTLVVENGQWKIETVSIPAS
jgi:type IV pilus biogenesis protein CpaD/CtpE